MRSYLLAVLMFFSLSAVAQNIVPNPNFALHSACPDNQGQLSYCDNWFMVDGTPDYFNACSGSPDVAVPYNMCGYQLSSSGAYAGLIGYNTLEPGGREYMGTTIAPLEIGASYKVTLVVSLANSSRYSIDGLGVFFYKDAVPTSTTIMTVPLIPQIDYSSYGVIRDTLHWVLLSKSFIADTAYTHLAIGNFKNDATVGLDSVAGFGLKMSYYFIDSVAVEKMPALSISDGDKNAHVEVYPNPFSSRCTISFTNPHNQPHSLHVYNMQGQLVWKANNIRESKMILDRGDLGRGLYFYELQGSENNVARGKLVIE